MRAVGASRGFRYVAVGGFNTLFGLAVFAGLLTLFGDSLHYLVILLVSHVIAVLTAFALHRSLVFRVRKHFWRDLYRFWSVYLVALGANLVCLPLSVELLHLSPLLAQALIITITALVSYVAHARFSFARPSRPDPASEASPAKPPVSGLQNHSGSL
jgi:putative flippase GtrA